jgi:hypothetical protein
MSPGYRLPRDSRARLRAARHRSVHETCIHLHTCNRTIADTVEDSSSPLRQITRIDARRCGTAMSEDTARRTSCSKEGAL